MKSQSNYKVSHPTYGIWWATSLYGAAKTIGCHPSLIYNNDDRKNEFKGWTIEKTVLELDDVPKKFINATNDFVKKFHWDTMMQMEEINGDNREDELDECQLETIRMSV